MLELSVSPGLERGETLITRRCCFMRLQGGCDGGTEHHGGTPTGERQDLGFQRGGAGTLAMGGSRGRAEPGWAGSLCGTQGSDSGALGPSLGSVWAPVTEVAGIGASAKGRGGTESHWP